MIHLGQPPDLMPTPKTKRYICVVAHTFADAALVSFDHVFTQATTDDSAYDSIEMLDLENRLKSQGATLVNNYVAEV